MTTDGVPTGQAFTDTPAVRPRAGDATGSSPVPSARRFAGP
jgi:hypothetical protein